MHEEETPPLPLKVSPEPDEALSSWAARIADALGVDAMTFQQALGFAAVYLDWDLDRPARRRLAAAAGLLDADLVSRIHPALVGGQASPVSSLRNVCPAKVWVVCRSCLKEDVEGGRPPHIRWQWTHPLSAWCFEHQEGLVAYEDQPTEIVPFEGLMIGRPGAGEAAVVVEPSEPFLRVQRALLDGGRTGDPWLRAFSDITDALLRRAVLHNTESRPLLVSRWLSMRYGGAWRLGRFGTSSDEISVGSLEARRRLALAGIAASFLDEPEDPAGSPASPHLVRFLGQSERRVKHGSDRPEKGGQRYAAGAGGHLRLVHAIWDPLFDLTARLGPEDAGRLQASSLCWPPELRRRMVYAAAFGVAAGSTCDPARGLLAQKSALHRQRRNDHPLDAAPVP